MPDEDMAKASELGRIGTSGEYLSQRGAMALAHRLQKYWHGKGYPAARFWAEPIGERFDKVGTYEIYRVNSNLVRGLPPRYVPGYIDAPPHMAGTSC
jgi:hypothetical protein